MATGLNFIVLTTVTAAVILLLKLAAGSKITPRGHMLMWLVLAVQIACVPLASIMPESELAARSYLPQLTETPSNMSELPDTEDYSVRGTMSENIDGTFGQEGYRQTVSMKVPFADKNISHDYYVSTAKRADEKLLFMICWGISSAIVFAMFILGGIKRKHDVSRLSECTDTETLMMLDELKKRAGIKEIRKISIRCGSSTTFLMKIHCPQYKHTAKTADGKLFSDYYVICMEDGFSQEEKRYVIAHELTHLKHGDLRLNLLSAVFIAVFWWNPVMWLAFRRFRRDMEVYCDYDAVKLTESKKEYAKTLVKAASAKSGFILGTTSFIGGEKEVSMRVKALAAFKKPKMLAILLALILLCAGCVCLILNPRSSNECTEFFETLTPENIVDVGFASCGEDSEGRFESDSVYISEKSEIKQLFKILHSFKAEDFFETENENDIEHHYHSDFAMSITRKNGHFPIIFYRDEEAGEDVYYISCGEYEEGENDPTEAVNGMCVTSPKLTKLLQTCSETNLHMNFIVKWEETDESGTCVDLMIENTELGNTEPYLEYDDTYRIEKYDESQLEAKWVPLEEIKAQNDKNDKAAKNILTSKDTEKVTIDFSERYGKLTEDGRYRIVKTFTQKLKSGSTVTQERYAKFSWCENRLRLENWDFLLEQPDGELSENIIDKLNKALGTFRYGTYNTNTLYCFLTSEYENPEKMNFMEFLRYYPWFDSFKEWTPKMKAEFEASEFWKEYREAGFTVDNYITPVKPYQPEVINEGLMYYAGITLDDIRANYSDEEWKQFYCEDIDRYITFTSDAGGGAIFIKTGNKQGDTVTLRGDTDISEWNDGKWESKEGTAELTLKEKDGRYLIQSYQIKERHNVNTIYTVE